MPYRKLGHLQQSVLDLAGKHEGLVTAELVYLALFSAQAGKQSGIDASTRNSISRILWSLQKRGLIKHAADGRGFELTGHDERRN
jgi:hypothetical protein